MHIGATAPRRNGLHCVSKISLAPSCFCYNVTYSKPILIIFGRNVGKELCIVKYVFTECYHLQSGTSSNWAIRLFSNRTVRQRTVLVIQWLFCLVWRHQIFTVPQLWSPNSPEWWITKSGYHAGKSVSSANTRCGHLNVKAAPD